MKTRLSDRLSATIRPRTTSGCGRMRGCEPIRNPPRFRGKPTDAQIVSEGIDQNLARLRRELTAAPDVIVTLGNGLFALGWGWGS